LSLENIVLFLCQVWANVRYLLPISISILENHSLQPYFGFFLHLLFLFSCFSFF